MINRQQELRVGTTWLREFEGLELEEYEDTEGHMSIGIGRNLDIFPLEDGEVITEESCMKWAYDQLEHSRESLFIHMPWLVLQPVNVRMLLTDMAYNMGTQGLLGFKNMLEAIKDGDYPHAARGLRDSKYYGQVGRRGKHHFKLLQSTRSTT